MTHPASALTIESVSVRRGAASVLSSVSTNAHYGELIGLIGPNGAGKTTLLRAAMGLQSMESGQIRLGGKDLADWGARALGRHLAYVPQSGGEAWPIRVDRFVALGRLPHLEPWRNPRPTDAQAVDAAMKAADVTEFADRPVTALSGGERARVHLARALAVEAPILFADEPIAGLDPYHQLHVMEILRRQAVEDQRCVVVVLHDLTLAHRFCDRLVLLKDGRIYADGPPDTVLTPQALKDAYSVVPAGPVDLADIVLPWSRMTPSDG